jgi:Mg2+-importing ATPase
MPLKWDIKLIERFMLVFGPVSSIFDFLTFYAMLALFHAGEALFQTGWFIESMVTQTIVVFCIRTRRLCFRSKPGKFLTIMNIGAIALAIGLPFVPWGKWFGFIAPPPLFFLFLVVATLAYVGLVEVSKVLFYRFTGTPQPVTAK